MARLGSLDYPLEHLHAVPTRQSQGSQTSHTAKWGFEGMFKRPRQKLARSYDLALDVMQCHFGHIISV